MVDKRTIVEFLVREGVTGEEITEILQIRCKEKKKIGETKAKTTEEKKSNGAADENSNSSIISADGKDEVSPKRNAKRTAKGKVANYGGSENEDQENLDDSQSDFQLDDSDGEKKKKKVRVRWPKRSFLPLRLFFRRQRKRKTP